MTILHKTREEWRKFLSSKTISSHSNDLEIQAIEDMMQIYDILEYGTAAWHKTLNELEAANAKIVSLQERIEAWQQLHDANSRTFDEVKERHHRSWQLMSNDHYQSTRENTELKNIIKDNLPEIWKLWQEDRKNKKA